MRATVLLATALVLSAQASQAQSVSAQPARAPISGGALPFGPGEVLRYRVNVARGGNIGQGEMRVEATSSHDGGPLDAPWRFVSEMQAKRGFIKATDRSMSWFDPERMATARFEKRERHPLSSADERVDIDTRAGTWRTASDSTASPLGSLAPLDELSFLYFVRTLPLDRDSVFQFNRHFDERRNPTLVSVAGEEILETDAGTFRTRVVVMHVRDPKHFKGIGLIRLNIDTSQCRLPVRIVSKMPIVGTTTLTLMWQRHTATRTCTAMSDST